MKFKRLSLFLLAAHTCMLAYSQPQQTAVPDNIEFVGNSTLSFNFTDAFCTSFTQPCSGQLNGQVTLAGDMYMNAWLYWNDGNGHTGSVIVPKAGRSDGFLISDMLVAQTGSQIVCYIVGAYRTNADPAFFARARILSAYWDATTNSFVFSTVQNLASIRSWHPKIAQDFKGNLIVTWWQQSTPSTTGVLIARRYATSASAPFYTATSAPINIYASITGTAGYTFEGEPDVCFSQGQPSTTDQPVTFTLLLRSAGNDIIKTYQADYASLLGGTTEDIVSVDPTQYGLSLPSIAVAKPTLGNLNDYCVAYSVRNLNTGEVDVAVRVKNGATLLPPRNLNHDYNEYTCYNSPPKVSGGMWPYVVVWSYLDCNNIIPGSNGNSVILGRYITYDGSDVPYSYIPKYFVVNNDFSFGMYAPGVSLTAINAWDNIYISYLYHDGTDVIPVGTPINYFIGYKYLGGLAYRMANIVKGVAPNETDRGGAVTNEQKHRFGVYPNPAAVDFITLELPAEDGPGEVSIRNTQGQLVFSKRVSKANTLQVDISQWPAGVYFASFMGKGRYHKKIIVE